MKRELLRWYRDNPREYPWRSENIDPYIVLVSEFMLQQTQARTITKRLPEFLALYPDVVALAAASNGEILSAWAGLGYNRRALRLRDTAKAIVEEHAGRVPSDPKALAALPGIGPYASAAIACFAYNRREVVIDVNVQRVYSRYAHMQTSLNGVDHIKAVRAFAEHIIPATNASEWHHAVMDLGAHICTARKPLCGSCPLQKSCASADSLRMLASTRTSKKAEPLFYGKPKRIWRGRVVQLLHNEGERPSYTVRELFKTLTGATAMEADVAWMSSVVDALAAEGMLVRKGERVRGVQ